jgi:hypothetical protein
MYNLSTVYRAVDSLEGGPELTMIHHAIIYPRKKILHQCVLLVFEHKSCTADNLKLLPRWLQQLCEYEALSWPASSGIATGYTLDD